MRIIVFIGEHQKSVSKSLLKQVCDHPGILSVVESVGSGKNALDFQIALHAGSISERDPNGYVHFVSKDKGFDVIVDALRAQKRFAARAPSFNELRFLKPPGASAVSTDEQIHVVAERITKGTKPRKRSTLASAIRSILGGESDPEKIIGGLTRLRFLVVDEDQKVVYLSRPNPSLEPKVTAVTPPAAQGIAPGAAVAHP